MSSTHYRTNNPWVCPILYRQQALGLMVSYPETSRNGTLLTLYSSDVIRGQNLEAEARATRPGLWGRGRGQGQFLEVEAKAEAKNNHENSTK